MTEVFVAGGQQRTGADSDKSGGWNDYARALITAVELEKGTSRQAASWVSPPEACPDAGSSFVFKAGTLDAAGCRYYACSQTEIVVYEFPSFRQLHYISIPAFNDLHHVTPTDVGTLMVTVTGLDMVMEVGMDGSVVNEWSVDRGPTWQRFSRDVDYRKVPSTKPHAFHPNYSFRLGGEIWVTRCDSKDALCLTGDGHFKVASAYIHDGHSIGDSIFFTAVDGQLVEVDATGRCVRNLYKLPPTNRGIQRGWCRGVEVLGNDLFLIGFSRYRPSKWKQPVNWLKKELGDRSSPDLKSTHIAAFDARRREFIWETELETANMNAVFSIHVPDHAAARRFFEQFR